MASTALVPTTTPIASTPAGLIKSKLNVKMGRAELTASSLDVYVTSPLFMMFGLIGALLGRKSKGKLGLAIDLATVRGVARGKHGLNKKVLELTVEGGAVHRLMIDDFDRFSAALREQLSARGSATWNVGPA